MKKNKKNKNNKQIFLKIDKEELKVLDEFMKKREQEWFNKSFYGQKSFNKRGK